MISVMCIIFLLISCGAAVDLLDPWLSEQYHDQYQYFVSDDSTSLLCLSLWSCPDTFVRYCICMSASFFSCVCVWNVRDFLEWTDSILTGMCLFDGPLINKHSSRTNIHYRVWTVNGLAFGDVCFITCLWHALTSANHFRAVASPGFRDGWVGGAHQRFPVKRYWWEKRTLLCQSSVLWTYFIHSHSPVGPFYLHLSPFQLLSGFAQNLTADPSSNMGVAGPSPPRDDAHAFVLTQR